MITYVSGTLVTKSPAEVVVDVGGMGYAVQVPMSSLERLPATGESVRLLTHHHIREDAQLLFGFVTESERMLFRAMIGVSGIGPKLALAALSAYSPDRLRDLILDGDAALLTRIPGVGKKTAERLVIELRDRLTDLDTEPREGRPTDASEVRADARAALEALGLSRADAEKRLRNALRDHAGEQMTVEALVRKALQS